MSAPLTIGSLFSGIGGLELGLERAGLGPTLWQVEQDAYCRAVLARHWPNAARFDDVRTVGAHNLPPVDVLCGGFPCQDVSTAGRRAGLTEGTRSGLWFEYARLIREVRPRYAVVENVTGLLTDGMGRVLGDLAELGYDAEWSVVPACAVGAPHTRERVFVVAYADGDGFLRHAAQPGRTQGGGADTSQRRAVRHAVDLRPAPRAAWVPEPRVGRVVDGFPGAMDGVRGFGNAVVPQVAEVVGRLIVARERARSEVAA